MTHEKIIEGNKLIALFMGAKISPRNKKHILLTEDEIVYHLEAEREMFALKYHSSWDWIMPVWIKIMTWGVAEYGVYWTQEITESIVKIQVAKSDKPKCAWIVSRNGLEIREVYEVILQFITWHNSQQKETECTTS